MRHQNQSHRQKEMALVATTRPNQPPIAANRLIRLGVSPAKLPKSPSNCASWVSSILRAGALSREGCLKISNQLIRQFADPQHFTRPTLQAPEVSRWPSPAMTTNGGFR